MVILHCFLAAMSKMSSFSGLQMDLAKIYSRHFHLLCGVTWGADFCLFRDQIQIHRHQNPNPPQSM